MRLTVNWHKATRTYNIGNHPLVTTKALKELENLQLTIQVMGMRYSSVSCCACKGCKKGNKCQNL